MGILCDSTPLQWADACFEGNGPEGTISIGIERKSLHDLLTCIDDASYAGHQRIGMKKMYQVNILLIEGYWKPRQDGFLMESLDGCNWWLCKPNGKPVMYSKLRRYIRSIGYTGVYVNFTQNVWHTAYDICEEYHYHQKKWDSHTSMREICKISLPQMNGKPSLIKRWAADIDGIGIKGSEDAERLFRRPIRLANAEEAEWLAVSGVGVNKAKDIVRQIHGY